ncbi:MAG: RNA 2'-phosphotransferase [Deltaproteobacteria bacterium]|nr:RNA 2'-phosphotransferase [Deltaproteobacteria bacterium]
MALVAPERLSRFLSYLLRHQPRDYPLRFDSQGFVQRGDLVEMVQGRFPEVTEEDILEVVEGSDKKRFELREGKVRATYGHSFPVDLGLDSVEPPESLYHGTARDLAESILREGLKPRGRQYVHLSPSVEDAIAVGRRRDPSPAILVIDSQKAHASGIRFFRTGPLFLTKEIPVKFLSLWEK